MVADPTLFMVLFDGAASFLIGQSRREDVIDEHEEIVSDGDNSPLLAFGCKAPEFTFEIAILLQGSSPRTLSHGRP